MCRVSASLMQCGAPLQGLPSVGSSGALNPTAAAFVPRISKDMCPDPAAPAAATAGSAAATAIGSDTAGAVPSEAEAEGEPAASQPAAADAAQEPGKEVKEAATSELAPPAVAGPLSTAADEGATHPPVSSNSHHAEPAAPLQDPVAALPLAAPAEEDCSSAKAGPAEQPVGADADPAAALPLGGDPFAARAPSTASLGGDPFAASLPPAAPVSESSMHGSEQVSELASVFSGTSLSEQLGQLVPETAGSVGLMESLADSTARATAAKAAAGGTAEGGGHAARQEGGADASEQHHGQPGGALMGLDGEGAAM